MLVTYENLPKDQGHVCSYKQCHLLEDFFQIVAMRNRKDAIRSSYIYLRTSQRDSTRNLFISQCINETIKRTDILGE